jgi:hypothetical protein
MNAIVSSYDYADRTFERPLTILTEPRKHGLYIEVKIGNVQNTIQIGRIVRILLSTSILPKYIAKHNLQYALDAVAQEKDSSYASYEMEIPEARFIMDIQLNNHTIKYQADIITLENEFAIGVKYGIRNRKHNDFDCTDNKPFLCKFQDYLHESLNSRRRGRSSVGYERIHLDRKTGIVTIKFNNGNQNDEKQNDQNDDNTLLIKL